MARLPMNPFERFMRRRRREWQKLRDLAADLWIFCRQNAHARKIGLRKARALIVFFVPNATICNGGLMSIAVLASESRKLNREALVVSVLCPDVKRPALRNRTFPNEETILRFSQVCRLTRLEKVVLHIPEYIAARFCGMLTQRQIAWARSVPDLQINIMNQNIQLMPPADSWRNLFGLAKIVTQTTAHARYSTQEVCDCYGIPLHRFSTYSNHAGWPFLPQEKKEKVIAISPDSRSEKADVLAEIRTNLSDYRVVEVQDMTFMEYLCLISRAMFTISFGEGFDGYFCQPAACGSVSFAVYNDEFFPGRDWLKCGNVYTSWQEMTDRIAADIRHLERDRAAYEAIRKEHLDLLSRIYSYQDFQGNLRRFYRGEYDFYPSSANASKFN